jgi:hypothetical protein
VRATVRVLRGGGEPPRIDDVTLSGDFTMRPASALAEIERRLKGVPADADTLTMHLERAYRDLEIQSPGLEPAHLVSAIRAAIS